MSKKTSVEIVLPVYNEEKDLPGSVARLHEFMSQNLSSYDWRILIADNGSTDTTLRVAEKLTKEFECVGVLHLDQKGRGRALHRAWLEGTADVMGYMDVDLSTDLEALPKLVDAIAKDGADVAIGSRLTRGSNVVNRTLKREVLSRGYVALIKLMFLVKFSDAQCGFKGISRNAAQKLLPLVQDRGWFLDSELLILAEKNGFRIAEIPVKWTDDPDTRVKVVKTAMGDVRGLLRMRFGGLRKVSKELRKESDK